MIEVKKADCTVTLVIEYDLISESNVNLIRKEIIDSIDEKTRLVILDFGSVELLDSAGIGMLLSARDVLEKQSCKLKLTGVSANIYQMLKLMRLDKRLTIETK